MIPHRGPSPRPQRPSPDELAPSTRAILVVEDDERIRFAVRDFLEARGYSVREASTCAEATESFMVAPPDAAILDYHLPDGNSLDLLPQLRRVGPHVAMLLLTAHGSIELAVRAIQLGADHFLTKPVNLPAMLAIIERMLDQQRLRRNDRAGRARTSRLDLDPFAGTSASIRTLAKEAWRAQESGSPALILGETGSGKGVLAAWLHRHGPRAEEAFVDINCAGLSRELLESELFGHEKGAFTGAVTSKEGLFEIAHRGTVFLDELGDMDPVAQAKLLKVIEDRRFRRLGGIRDREVDVRIIAATHRDLPAMVRQQRFRADLYYRLNVVVLRIPPLRERREDIPVLAERLLGALAAEMGRGPLRLSPSAAEALRARAWHGNLRELRNELESAVLRSAGDELTPADFTPERTAPFGEEPPTPIPAELGDLTLEELERRHISRILAAESGHVERAAVRLGIGRSTLYHKLKALGIATTRA